MHDKATYVQTIFSSIARRYDFINSLLSLNIDKSWRNFTVRMSELQPDDEVLDVCTGTGELALAYRRALDSMNYANEGSPSLRSGVVIGADFCEPMLEVGRKKLKKKHFAGVEFMQADTLDLPFKANHFDVVSVGFGIRNVAGLKKGLNEMVRVTKPGGRVVILEFTQPPNRLFRAVYYFYFRRILPLVGRLFSRDKNKAYTYLPDSVLAFPDAEGLKRLMEHAGLKKVKFYFKTFGIVAIHVGHK